MSHMLEQWKFLRSARRTRLCVLSGSHNEERLCV
jgi:hypothetical protein